MKKYLLSNIIILLIFLLFISCTGDVHYTPSMRRAELIMDTVPDSARILLFKDSSIIRKENKSTRMYYDMLLTLAKDKCYIPHTSDSIMLKVADYYQYHGTPRQKFMSYYLLGRIYTDMNLTADAFDYYNKALSVKDIDSSFIYVARANNQIGHLYMYQDMYQRALPYFYSTYKYAVAAKDTSVMVFALRDIGRVYDELNDAKRSISYYERSVNLLEKSKLYRLEQHIYPEVATIYLKDKNYNKAELYFHKSLSSISNEEKSTIYYIGGRIFEFKNEIDMAITYYKMSIASTGMNIYSKKDAASSLNSIYTRKKMYSDACMYADSCQLYTDSIRHFILSQNKNLVLSQKNKITIETENNKLRTNKYILIIFIILIIAIMGFPITRIRRTIKQKNERFKKVTLALKLDEQSSQEEIIRRINETNTQLNLARKMSDETREKNLLIDKNSESLKLTQIRKQKDSQNLMIELFTDSETYKMLREKGFSFKSDIHITKNEWDFIYDFLNRNCDSFVKELLSFYSSISEKELHVCCLIKLSFTNAQISNILNQSQQATSAIRKRLYEKMFNKKESPDKLDHFIKTFPDVIKEK